MILLKKMILFLSILFLDKLLIKNFQHKSRQQFSFTFLFLQQYKQQNNQDLKQKYNTQIIYYLREQLSQCGFDQKIKSYITEAFHKILTQSGVEFINCIEDIFAIQLNLFQNQDENIVYKTKENDEIIKAKLLYYFEQENSQEKKIHQKILKILKKPYEMENLYVKGWVLGWLKFLINLEKNHTDQFFSELVINLILFISKAGHEELRKNTINLLNFAQKKYMISDIIWDINYNFQFINEMLQNYIEKDFSDTQRITTIDWTMKILQQIFLQIENQKVKIKDINEDKLLEEILLKSIQIIISFPDSDSEDLKDILLEYNNILQDQFDIINQLILKDEENPVKYDALLKFICNMISRSGKQTLSILIDWAEKLFKVSPHSFSQYVYTMIDILDSNDEMILNLVIQFIANVIHQLDNFDITAKIIFYFFKNIKVDTNLSGFLKFIKILFDNVQQTSFLLNILREIYKQAGEQFFSKIIYHFNLLLIFEENFQFLRNLFRKFKQKQISDEEKVDFQKIFSIWCFHSISLFSLCIISGCYELASEIINEITQEELTESDLIHLTQFVKMIELPYFSHIRIDLLNIQKNYYLYKSLQCVLMILPQGEFFELLKNRLQCVAYFAHMHHSQDIQQIQMSQEELELKKIYEEYKKSGNEQVI